MAGKDNLVTMDFNAFRISTSTSEASGLLNRHCTGAFTHVVSFRRIKVHFYRRALAIVFT